jgi:hypothetical protein
MSSNVTHKVSITAHSTTAVCSTVVGPSKRLVLHPNEAIQTDVLRQAFSGLGTLAVLSTRAECVLDETGN